MNATHTPGPWALDTEDLRGGRYWVVRIPGQETVDIHAEDNGQANAALIAAAPDLLAGLRGLVEWGREHTSPRDANSPHALLIAAVAAIAKAEGRAP